MKFNTQWLDCISYCVDYMVLLQYCRNDLIHLSLICIYLFVTVGVLIAYHLYLFLRHLII